MAALLHLVHTVVAAVAARDHGVAVLDPGGEQEMVRAVGMPAGAAVLVGFSTFRLHIHKAAIRLPKRKPTSAGAGGGGVLKNASSTYFTTTLFSV